VASRLKTLNNKLEAPKSRIGDPADAYNYSQTLIQADDRRALSRAHVIGNIQGNAPYRRAAKDKTNLNFRQGAAVINQMKTPYYDLLVEVPLLYDVRTAFGRREEQSDWSQIISEEFHRMVTDWEDWDFVSQFSQTQMLIYGPGIMYRKSGIDWRPDVARVGEVLVEDEAPSRLSELEAIVIRKAYKPTELMRMIADEKRASDLGWNPKAVKEAVRDSYTATDYPPDASSTYEYIQQKLKNGDIYYGYSCERVWTAHILNVEFPVGDNPGKVSHHIIRTDRQVGEFLYSKIGAFESLAEIISPFFYDIGDGTWHSIRGLGTEIFPYCQIFNKLRCREVDAAMIAASVLVQAKDGNAAQAAQMLTLDNMKIIPEGVSFIEHAIGQNMQATVDVRRDMEQGMIQNIGGLLKAPGTANPRKGQKQAIMEMQQSAALGKGNINRYYASLDQLGYWMFVKASNPNLRPYHLGAKEALAFQKRCIARGVPLEALQELDSIKAYRSVGAGSAANAIMITDFLLEVAPNLSEPGKMAAIRVAISRMAGERTANLLMGPIEGDDEEAKNMQDWQAAVENRELRTGADGQSFFLLSQNHVIHADSHLTDMEKHLKEVEAIAAQRGLELEDLIPLETHLESAGPHSKQHIDQLKGDKIREKDFKSLSQRWAQVAHMGDQVRKNIEQMQKERQQQAAQQPQQGPNPDLLKLVNYKDAPEGVKAQIEQAAGTPRQQGEASVPGQNLQIKEASLQLKTGQAQQTAAIKDIQTAQSVQKHNKEMAQPEPAEAQ
jgi:hypothetical protein